jgi:hypothetical protein
MVLLIGRIIRQFAYTLEPGNQKSQLRSHLVVPLIYLLRNTKNQLKVTLNSEEL